MSKKAMRRAARQSFPKTPPKPDRSKTYGQRPARRSRSGSAGSAGRRPLRPPSLKRAAVQGVIMAVIYLVVIRFIWKQSEATTATYVIAPIIGFVIFTGVAYGVDKFTYARRLRKSGGSQK
jgi:hypothetical protein